MASDDSQGPWDRDQHGKISQDFIEVDGVTLPGVVAREIVVQYDENVNSEWPIKLTVSFYLDELEVDPKVASMVDFSVALTGPREAIADD